MKTGDRVRGSGFRAGSLIFALLLAAGCASPKEAQFTDADWVSQTTTGRGSYDRGDYRRGSDAFGRAEQRARALDDADALAVAAVNRAICLLAEEKAEEALAGVDEALADARVSKARQAELKVAGARASVALGKPDDALAQVDEALKLGPSSALRAQALLAKSSAELAKEETSAATKALSDGLSEKEWSELPLTLRAEYAAQRAKIATAEQRLAEAAELLDEASALWKQAGRLPEMARALAEAGRQAQAADDLAGACDRYYRSARSLWAQGLQPEALRTLEDGVDCAEQLDDEAVAKRMAKLFVTFKDEKRLSE
jgi:tetratricopeptide (TPR) repeat protein